jgi:radical SAM peptide maturase (CXXX-repeat target family)
MILTGGSKISNYINMDTSTGIVLDFIGGEPLLEVELIDAIMDYFVKRAFELEHPLATRYKICISSNGTLYFTKPVQDFINKWHRHLALGISIDGNKTLHDACRVFPDGSGSYDISIAAALDYMKRFGFLGSKMTVAPGNVAFVDEAVESMLDNGYTEIFLNCVYEQGWDIEHAKTLYQQLKMLADRLIRTEEDVYISMFDRQVGHRLPEDDNKNWCGGTGLMLTFNPDGVAYPCIRYTESSIDGDQPSFRIGDLDSGIAVADEDRARVDFLNSINRRSQSTDECWNCPINAGCAWCSAYNYQVTGTPNKRVTFICPMHKARVLANCYYWNKLARKQGSAERYSLDMPREWAEEIAGDETDMLFELAKED